MFQFLLYLQPAQRANYIHTAFGKEPSQQLLTVTTATCMMFLSATPGQAPSTSPTSPPTFVNTSRKTGIGKASTALQWYGYTVVWQRTGLPISGTRNQHAKTGASRDTTVLTCFCYVNLPLSWGGNQLESQTEHCAGQETYSQDRMLQCTDIAQRSYSL